MAESTRGNRGRSSSRTGGKRSRRGEARAGMAVGNSGGRGRGRRTSSRADLDLERDDNR